MATRATLGHRRLSIIDLAGGHQPLHSPDGTIQLVATARSTTIGSCVADLEHVVIDF